MTARGVLEAMFEQAVVAKDAAALERCCGPGFELHTNGRVQPRAEFLAGHEVLYRTDITYAVEFDEQAWVEAGDRAAARLWVTTTRPGEAPTRLEVVLLAEVDEGRLHRIWELTWPDWTRVAALEGYPGASEPSGAPGRSGT